MLVSKTREETREKREKNKNASESTHSVIRPLMFSSEKYLMVKHTPPLGKFAPLATSGSR